MPSPVNSQPAAAAPPPVAVTREGIPADLVAKEREIAQGQLDQDPKNAKKPPEIRLDDA